METGGLQQVVAALEVVHRASSTNEQRRQAQEFLDSVKNKDDAPLWGWQLASSKNEYPDIVRHFGLTLLQHTIHYKFAGYDEPRRLAVRNWVIDLAFNISANDPHYIKEKISLLWVALAKRVWGLGGIPEANGNPAEEGEHDRAEESGADGWFDMDKQLVKLWNASACSRELTLSIFRTLFEDLYMLDDPVAAKRAPVLSAQCIEIVTSEEDLAVEYESRVQSLKKLREGPEGWLNRWANLLRECICVGISDQEAQLFAVKVLETLKTCLYWVFPLAIRKADLLDLLSSVLRIGDTQVRILATDCLHALLTRSFSNDDDFQAVVGSVFLTPGMNLLLNVYDSIKVDIDNFDEKAYILMKKLVEMIVGLGEYLNTRTRLPENADVALYLQLVLKTTTSPSLVVSGFSLQFWCSVLRVEKIIGKEHVEKLLPQLLQVAAERCVKYDDVGEDHISRQFLDMDFDSTPEATVFLENYRRFIEDIIRLTVCRTPIDAISWLKSRMNEYFSSELGWQSLNSSKLEYEGNPAYFLAYSQFMIVEAALRGVTRWRIWYKGDNRDQIGQSLVTIIEDWGSILIKMSIKDPLLLRKMVQTLVQFAPVLKDSSNQLLFAVLEKVLTACTTEAEPNASDDDRELVRELRTSCGTELNRLAYMIPEALMQIYNDLERVIGELLMSGKLSEHETVSFKSFLLVVSQRSTSANKAERFSAIVDPMLVSWSDEGTMKGLSDLQWFMERVGIVKIAEYFRSRGVTANTNLLSTEMDDTGRALKTELKLKWRALFPIRATRIFVQYTIEKLDHSSEEYKALLALWKPRIQPILPHILQLIAQIEAYHNPANWRDLPPEVQSFVKTSCQERFWEIGVSSKTKDEFHDESLRAMQTLRDFADNVGHSIRYTREYAFLTLGSITQLEETLYEIPGMPEQLWNALAGDSVGITSYAWRHMISLVLRSLVKNCPINYIKPFMTEFLPPMLSKLNEVLVEKWNRVYQNGIQLVGGEDQESLSEEMMDEHLLRHLTAIVDRLLIDLVGQFGGVNSISKTSTATESMVDGPVAAKSEAAVTPQQVLRETVLGNKDVLGPFLALCTRIMTFKDVRCSFNCCLIVRNILPQIMLKDEEVDMFLCNDMTKTCLEILTDPYFADVHNETGYIITTIYTVLRPKYDRPLETLADLMPEVSVNEFGDFENRLVSQKTLRQQRGVFLEFLATVQAMRNGQNTMDNETSESRNARRMKAEAERKGNKNNWLTKKSTQGGNLMDEDGLEQSAIANLFGE
ncbi:hypothetical protein TRVA0_032S01640 [Trichomonascus vanleenenianus]|uniref:karyopherin MSN5 n=1 Tax=Trichomonascus vanleenenianus TaxID=2268995 RepID=UPI003ECB5143